MPDTEPENYSIDEMMDRLRSRSDGSGSGGGDEPELVTRSDGSQMYKVRKRKRRSQQPKKEAEKRKNRLQIVQVVSAGAVIGLVGIGFVGTLVYLNSTAFRTKVSTQMETWTGAKVETTEFRLTPISVAAKAVHLSWPEGSALESLKAYEIKGDVNAGSYFSGPWNGTEISARTGTLLLRAPGVLSPSAAPQGIIPFQFRYRSTHFNIIGGAKETPAFQVAESEASFSVVNQEGTKANLQLEGGTLTLGDWGNYNLKFASLQVEHGAPRLGTARLSVPGGDRSELELTSQNNSPISFDGGQPSVYELRASRIPLVSLIGKPFSGLLSGDIDSPTGAESKNGTVTIAYGAKDSLSIALPFRASPSSSMSAARLPLLGFLADQFGNEEFRAPKFDLDARGTIYRTNSGTRLEDLSLDTRGFISISGKLDTDAYGNLSGNLEVGIPESFASEAGPAFLKTFSRRARALVWASVKVSGTIAKPLDDLSTNIHNAGGGADEEWNELTTPAKEGDKR